MSKSSDQAKEVELQNNALALSVEKKEGNGAFYAEVFHASYAFSKAKDNMVKVIRTMPGCVVNSEGVATFPFTTEDEAKKTADTFANVRTTFFAAHIAQKKNLGDTVGGLRKALAILALAAPDNKEEGVAKRSIEDEKKYGAARTAFSQMLFLANIESPDPKAIAKRAKAQEAEQNRLIAEKAKDDARKLLTASDETAQAQAKVAQEARELADKARQEADAAKGKEAKAKADADAAKARQEADKARELADKAKAEADAAALAASKLGVQRDAEKVGAPQGNANASQQNATTNVIYARFVRAKTDAASIVKAIEQVAFDISACQAVNEKDMPGELGSILRDLMTAAMDAKRKAIEWQASQDAAKSAAHIGKLQDQA